MLGISSVKVRKFFMRPGGAGVKGTARSGSSRTGRAVSPWPFPMLRAERCSLVAF